jgi:GAF domain-containing protein
LSELALDGLEDQASTAAVSAGEASASSSPEDPISRLARLAARILHAPLASVALTREYYARCSPGPAIEAARYDRTQSIGANVLTSGSAIIVPDTTKDPRFESHRETIDVGIRAFAGVPIVLASGAVIGAMKVRDTRARVFTPADIDALTLLAGFVSRELAFRDLAAIVEERAKESRAARPLTGRAVLVVGASEPERSLLRHCLTLAGALVDATEPGAPTEECLSDAKLVGVPYSVVVLAASASASASHVRSRASSVPIVAVCDPGVSFASLLGAGCDEVLPAPLGNGTPVVEACERVVDRLTR